MFLMLGKNECKTKISCSRVTSFSILDQETPYWQIIDSTFMMISIHGGTLIIPAFTRGKTQLSQQDVERSKELLKVRVHVERIIGILKSKYTILQGTLLNEWFRAQAQL